jgi:hypothetical protein
MKTLLTNGCSWTWGGGLDQKYDEFHLKHHITWPGHLKRAMKFDRVVNLAAGNGSNQRIFRTTLNWILEQDQETLKNTTAVIQFTEWSRCEFYMPSENVEYENIHDRWAFCNVNCAFLPNSNGLPLDAEREYRYRTYTDIEGFYNYLSYCAAMTNLLQTYNIKHYFWNFVAPMFRIPEPFKTHLLGNYNWLEPEGRHLWEYQRIGSHDPHPDEVGHKQLADHIKAAIEKVKYYE